MKGLRRGSSVACAVTFDPLRVKWQRHQCGLQSQFVGSESGICHPWTAGSGKLLSPWVFHLCKGDNSIKFLEFVPSTGAEIYMLFSQKIFPTAMWIILWCLFYKWEDPQLWDVNKITEGHTESLTQASTLSQPSSSADTRSMRRMYHSSSAGRER